MLNICYCLHKKNKKIIKKIVGKTALPCTRCESPENIWKHLKTIGVLVKAFLRRSRHGTTRFEMIRKCDVLCCPDMFWDPGKGCCAIKFENYLYPFVIICPNMSQCCQWGQLQNAAKSFSKPKQVTTKQSKKMALTTRNQFCMHSITLHVSAWLCLVSTPTASVRGSLK